jgi:hypothetical protein
MGPHGGSWPRKFFQRLEKQLSSPPGTRDLFGLNTRTSTAQPTEPENDPQMFLQASILIVGRSQALLG